MVMNKICQFGIDSEFKPLKEVMLGFPDESIGDCDPEKYLFLGKINFLLLRQELLNLQNIYEKNGIIVHRIKGEAFQLNMMYMRDLFFMTPYGAILASMGVDIRRGEEECAKQKLLALNIPVFTLDDSAATFEGADALWMNKETVLIGVGNRTNKLGFSMVKKILSRFGVNAIPIEYQGKIPQHLLGGLQFIDRDLIAVREKLLSSDIRVFLKKNNYSIINIPENIETLGRQAMNIVTLAPRKIIMPTNVPMTMKIFIEHDIKVIDVVDIKEIINGAGGLACATGIVAREC